MAVFQGARLRGVALPAEPRVRPRARAAVSVPTVAKPRSSSGVRPTRIIIAVILVSTMVALAYLTQTLGSNATSGEISRLTATGNTLRDDIRTLTLAVEVRTDPGDVAKRARALGLKPLDDPVVLPAP